jgi:transposase-like protein
MSAHKNARTTPIGRAVMVRRVLEEGWTVAAAAADFEVSVRTVRKWLARFRSEGAAGLQNRSTAPRLVANKLPARWLAMVVRLRREYRMTGEENGHRSGLTQLAADPALRRDLGRDDGASEFDLWSGRALLRREQHGTTRTIRCHEDAGFHAELGQNLDPGHARHRELAAHRAIMTPGCAANQGATTDVERFRSRAISPLRSPLRK